MTITSLTNEVLALGNGSATSFSFSPMVISASADLTVVLVDANGDETVLAEGNTSSTYSVTVAAYPGTGSITYPASGGSPIASGVSLLIRRVVALTQGTALSTQGRYDPDVQEAAFDRLTMIAQQLDTLTDRSLKIPASDDRATVWGDLPIAADRAGMLLAFDENGKPAVVAGSSATAFYEVGTWTPEFTFATPGDLAITYSRQAGSYIRVGRLALLQFSLVTSAFTHSTGSGSVRVTGSPFTIDVATPGIGFLAVGGLTKANYTDFGLQINSSNILFTASGSGQARANPVAADFPSGGNLDLRGSITLLLAA